MRWVLDAGEDLALPAAEEGRGSGGLIVEPGAERLPEVRVLG